MESGLKLASQRAGHASIRLVRDGVIAKSFNAREAWFYENVRDLPLARVVPKCFGTAVIEKRKWLLLEDVTRGMASPCVADLKLGTRSYQLDASQEKRIKQITHTLGTTTRTHAIRISDVCLRKDGKVVDAWNKREGRSVSAEEMALIMKNFAQGHRRDEFVKGVLDVTRALKETYVIAPNLRLYSASVMAVYDGDKPVPPVRVSLIDFAHGYRDVIAEGGKPDEDDLNDNALIGLENLLKMLQ